MKRKDNLSEFLQFGKSLADAQDEIKEFIRTGSTLTDMGLGGGIAKGRIVNIIGDESTGKTLLALSICRKFQQKYKDGYVIYDDSEAALDPKWAMDVFKLDPERTRILDIEECSETVEDLETNLGMAYNIAIKEDIPVLWVEDSLDALGTERTKFGGTKKRKGEDNIKDESMRDKLDKPAVLSGVLRRLNQKLKRAGITLIFVSQLRAKIGVFFGDNTDVTGGKALKFYCVQRIKMADVGKIKDANKRVVGINLKVKVIKNKAYIPFKEAYFPVYFNSGIDDRKSCMDYIKKYEGHIETDIPDLILQSKVRRLWKEIEDA